MITINDYNKVVYETPAFQVRVLDEVITDLEEGDNINEVNYAVIHKEYGTLEDQRQKLVDALSVTEQMQLILDAESFKFTQPTRTSQRTPIHPTNDKIVQLTPPQDKPKS